MQTLEDFRATKRVITAEEFGKVMECEPGDLTNFPITALYHYKRERPTYTHNYVVIEYVVIEAAGRFEFWWGMGGTDFRADLAATEETLFEGL